MIRRAVIRISPLILLGTLFIWQAQAQTWSEPIDVGDRNTGIVGVGDFNRDGWPDVAYSRSNGFQWYAGPNFDGTADEYDLGAGEGTSYGGTVVDLNGDGWPDLVASDGARSSGPGRLWVFVHPGSAALATQPWERVEIYSQAVWHQNDLAVADMDNDGRLDVVVRTRADERRLVVALQNGDFESWTTRFWATGETANAPEGLAVGDLDNDGENEIVLSGVYWDNPGGWRQGDPLEYEIDNNFVGRAVKAVVADLDDDGQSDDVAMVTAEGSTRVYLAWYRHNGQPAAGEASWERVILADDVTNIHTLVAADLTGDQRTDLLAGASFGSTGVDIYQGQPSGQSFLRRPVDSTGQLYVAAVADLNRDGLLDIVGPVRWQQRVVAYFNQDQGDALFADGFE